ncbi:MAG: hypothetical protein KIT11_04755 [Fimbriimonadaceae bacterium]|nr:hypothetical protein [Fimbriimonadaceae bacterium]QYK56797.1 MAG: hypothetical protein KF733_04770 [Fimbriimonadaceae bacterium]
MIVPIGLLVVKCTFCALFAIAFLQSGIDKVSDWAGNLGWLKGHFEKTFLAKSIPAMLGVLTVMELSTGLACAGSFFALLMGIDTVLPVYALAGCCATLLALFFGQRIAKDYAGAAGLVPYILAAGFGTLVVSFTPT